MKLEILMFNEVTACGKMFAKYLDEATLGWFALFRFCETGWGKIAGAS
jgi:hypothetical protein